MKHRRFRRQARRGPRRAQYIEYTLLGDAHDSPRQGIELQGCGVTRKGAPRILSKLRFLPDRVLFTLR